MRELNGETRAFIQQLNQNELKIKKNLKRLIPFNIGLSILFLVFSISYFEHARDMQPYIKPFFSTLLSISILFIALNIFNFFRKKKELIYYNLVEHQRVLKDIAKNYQDEPIIKSHMEVLLVGCDMKYKDDYTKIKFIVKNIQSDFNS